MTESFQYKSAVQELAEKAKIIADAYPKETGATRKRLRAIHGRIRDEIFEIVKAELQNSSSTYVALDKRFKKSRDDLKWVQKRAEDFKINAARAVRLANLAARFAALL